MLEASLSRFINEARELVEADLQDAAVEGNVARKASAEALLDVLSEGGRAVRPVGTLHLTLGVMSLRLDGEGAGEAGFEDSVDGKVARGGGDGDDERAEKSIHDAVALLRSLDVSDMLRGSTDSSQNAATNPVAVPLRVDLTGLKSMHSPSKTSFLYIAPTALSGRLMPSCQRLKDAFVEHGLMLDEGGKGKKELKLHVTVLNTIYARSGKRRRKQEPAPRKDTTPAGMATDEAITSDNEDANEEDHVHVPQTADAEGTGSVSSQTQERAGKGLLCFDARGLLHCFEDFEWAKELQLDRIAICKIGAKKIFDDQGNVVDEAYEEIATRPLP